MVINAQERFRIERPKESRPDTGTMAWKDIDPVDPHETWKREQRLRKIVGGTLRLIGLLVMVGIFLAWIFV